MYDEISLEGHNAFIDFADDYGTIQGNFLALKAEAESLL